MGYRKENLSFTASATIHKGRALKLLSDGTVGNVVEVTSSVDHIIGWSMEDVVAGGAVSVRIMTDGTIYCEYETGHTFYPGQWISMGETGKLIPYSTTLTQIDTAPVIITATQMEFTDSTATWTPDEWAGYSMYVNSGEHNGERYVITGNTATTLVVTCAEQTNWTTIPFTITLIKPLMGICLEHITLSGTDKIYAETLMLRQISKFDRDPT